MTRKNVFVIGVVAAALEMFAGEATYPFSWYAGPTVADFPAPMTLRAGENGFSYDGFAAADGSDLRVKDAGGNLLPHEIERWDPSGYSIVWVKLPAISPAATVTLSWGDSTAAASADGVWDDDFLHVFHFGDDAKKNSSSWNYTTTQTTVDRVNGVVGQGHTWKGDKGHNTREIKATGLNIKEKTGGSSTFTISCWVKDGASSIESYICRLGTSSQLCLLYNYDRIANPHLVELYGPSAAFRTNSKILLPDTDWHHVAYTYDGANLIKYLDGAVYGTNKVTATVSAFAETSHNIYIGGTYGTNNPMEGSVDEFRLEKTVRSADWIKACASTPALVHDYDDVYELEFPEYDRDAVLHDFPTMVTLCDGLPGLSDTMKKAIYNRYRLHFFTEDGTELFTEPETVPVSAGSIGTYWLNLPEFARGTKVRVQATPTPWPTLTHSTTAAYATNIWGEAYYHVWHLASTLYRYDSASGRPLPLATAQGWTNYAASATGPTGRYGAVQTGSNAVIHTSIASDARALTNRFTVSFWAKKCAEDFANPRKGYLFLLRNDKSSRQIAVITGYSGDGNEFRLWDSSAGISSAVSTYCVSIPDADWHHYAFTCDGATTRTYRDGVEAASFASAFNFNLPSITNNWAVTVGGSTTRPQSFYGLLDEFRIETEPRSADWIYASYRNQRGVVHDLANLPAPVFGTERSVTPSALDALDFTADLVCKVASDVTFYYGPSDGGTSAAGWTNSLSLGAREAGALVTTVSGLEEDQCVCGRFRAVNAYGEAWSAPLAGRAWTEPVGRYARIVVTNLAEGVALEDFPLCVKLPASVGLPDDPAGLRFVDSNGNALSFEIETWDAAGESVVWVRVPSLARGTVVRALWSAMTVAHGATHADAVWNSEYKAVYHLASGNDSSPNARHFETDTLSVDAAGAVGRGRSFAGTASKHMTRHAPWLADLSGAFTISGWIRPAADATGQAYMMQMYNDYAQFAILYNWDGGRVLQFFHGYEMNAYGKGSQSDDMRYTASPMTIPDDGDWHHFAYSYDQEAFSVYLDGELLRRLPREYGLGSGQPGLQNVNFELGQTRGGGNRFKGDLDEIRFESARRSDAWIRACYLNQKGALLSVTPAAAGFKIIFR